MASLVGAKSLTLKSFSEYQAENSGRILSEKVPTNSEMCMGQRPPVPCSNQILQPEETRISQVLRVVLTQNINDSWRLIMSLTAEQREQVATELKRFAGDLNLTDEQKEKLHAALAEARERVGEYLRNNPNTTKADIIAKVRAHRDEIRQRVVNFLSPEQLSKWDSEIAKAKEFLGQKLDA